MSKKKVLPFYRISWPERARRLLAGASVLSGITIIVYVIKGVILASGSDNVFPDKVYNELTKSGIDVRLNQSINYFQIATVILGGLWGLLVAKRDEAALVFEDIPEIIMLFCSALLLVMSTICHNLYVKKIEYIYWEAADVFSSNAKNSIQLANSIPDIFAPNINYLYQAQVYFLVTGVIIGLCTFYSTHKLKSYA